jgi:hypothetical protein
MVDRLQSWCTPGMKVEVILTEDGLVGSRYVGKVMSMKKCSALVEFEVCLGASPACLLLSREPHMDADGCSCARAQAFNEEGSEALLQEWHKADNLQPIPPPTPDAYLKVRAAGAPPKPTSPDGAHAHFTRLLRVDYCRARSPIMPNPRFAHCPFVCSG